MVAPIADHVPALQAKQYETSGAPIAEDHRPAAQLVQEVEPAKDQVPGPQAMQDEAEEAWL